MDNIKESKEYQLAKDWERAVNDYGFNPKRFAAAIPEMHPTLQQSLYRLVKECIVVMADETPQLRRPQPCIARGSEVHHGIPQGSRETHPIKITDV